MRTGGRRLKNVEPGLYRFERDGKTYGAYYALYHHEGRRIQESLETDNLQEARRLLRQRRANERADPSQRSLTLAAAADKWLATRQAGARTTRENDLLFTDRIKKEWPGGSHAAVRTIKASEALAFVAGLRAEKSNRELGASYRNHFAWTLRGIFEMCVQDGVRPDNPMARYKSQKAADVIRHVPTPTQFRQILQAIRGQQARLTDESAAVIEFYGLAGVGRAEAAGLQWQDVDLERGQIHLLRRKTKKAFSIKIYPRLRPLIERLRREAGEVRPETEVFKVKDPKRALSSACRDLKLPKFSTRSFRRMFITEALEAGIDPGIVARTQGHRDGGVLILRTYRHIRPQFEDEQLERLK